MSQSAPRRHPPSGGNADVGSMSAKFVDTEWEARESQRQRELEEARARAAQMEKTMKWWSDCTANWREKWSKVRTERNKAREEAKQLRSNLEAAIKESNSYKREKCELEMQITQLKKEMEKVHTLMMKHAGRFNKASLDAGDEADARDARGDNNCSPDISSDGLKNVNSEDGLVTKLEPNLPDDEGTGGVRPSHGGTAPSSLLPPDASVADLDIEEYILQGGAMPKHSVEFRDKNEQLAEERRLIQQLSKDDHDEEYLLQKISMLQLRLEDAQKTVQIEREERTAVQRNLEKARHDMQEMRDKCEELRSAKQDAVRELLTLQEQHRVEMRITHNSLQEEIAARETLERRLCELRTELERLQAENAAEWGKRERLETEKLNMERETKKLRAECQDLQERLERKGRPLVNSDVELRSLQQELLDKNKELSDLRHSHSKMKKMLSEANTELGHAVRRAEQYETEVKRLRSRVEELKHELAGAEDELDAACNHVRRLQRTNEELSGQTEGLQVQIQHLQTSNGSPKQHDIGNYKATNRSNYTANVSYKPNINDLKQLFDNSSRGGAGAGGSGGGPSSKHQPSSSIGGQIPSYIPLSSGSYYDAKPSYIDHDAPSPPSLNNNKYEFERAKQKFDNITRAAAAASTTASGGGGGGGAAAGHKSRSSAGVSAAKQQHHSSSSSAIPKRYDQNVFPGTGGGGGGSSGPGSIGLGSESRNIRHMGGMIADDMPPTKSHGHDQQLMYDGNCSSYDQSPATGAPGAPVHQAGRESRNSAHKPMNIGKLNDVNLDGLKVSEDDETP
ncbi:coiled-coil domain-containing protein 102A isoform X1 [Anopheles aquasalis]|uniref:coiled-coil domain-containing protein 102A isoform X1 n=1 Tax=Anopheles aquasalis TaxID=42839 RepID=UPI00215AE352|nr:coiled-coil domain-containing protein 102A isoform X1 [Anopheles aquasalis]